MNYLAQITFGPVQGFISTARRSRDLWYGSLILSEISKAAALKLNSIGAKLVFPHADDLEKWLAPKSDFLVTNIIVCELSDTDEKRTAEALCSARAAATNRWAELCVSALEQIGNDSQDQVYDQKIWNAQLEDVVEVFAVAVPFEQYGYAAANDALRTLMANRKNTRAFTPFRDTANLPKSSLDGAQSTVLNKTFAGQTYGKLARRRRSLGVERNEQLDTAALVKRLLGRERHFLPAARMAAQEWVARVKSDETSSSALKTVRLALEGLAKSDIGTQFGGKYEEYDWVKPLPFDGQLLYRNRVAVERGVLDETSKQKKNGATEKSYTEDEYKKVRSSLDELDRALKDLNTKFGAPQPYYGLLLADGDRMGELIDTASAGARDGGKHREISKALSEFAQSVPESMSAREGACIYSGGDDVLGLVPLHRAVEIGNALRIAFYDKLKPIAYELNLPPAKYPTLSVGIALVHFLEPLGDARALAHQAERIAKGAGLESSQQRNALCLLAKPRGGAAITTRIRWEDESAMGHLATWQSWLREGATKDVLPRGLPHELDVAFAHCQRVFDPSKFIVEFAEFWNATLKSTLKKKRPDNIGLSPTCESGLLKALAFNLKQKPPDNIELSATCKGVLLKALAENCEPGLKTLQMARWLSGQATEGTDQ